MPEETPEERANRRKRLQFLCNSKDPEAVRCRLFVSGIATESVNKPGLIALFTPFGRVYDLTVHKGYIFVQYDNLASATLAIQKLNKSIHKGTTMLVKLAEKGKKAEMAEKEICRFFIQGTCMRGKNCFFMHVDPNKLTANKSVTNSNAPPTGQIGPGATGFAPNKERGPPRRGIPDIRSLVGGGSGRETSRFQEHPRGNALGGGLPPPNRAGTDQRSDRGPDRDRRDLGRSSGLVPSNDRPLKRPLPNDFEDVGGRRPRPDLGPGGFGNPADRHGGRPPPPAIGSTRRPIFEPPVHRPLPPLEPKALPRVNPSAAAGIPRRDAPPVDLRPPYDCVIIAGNEMQRNYCNLIEKRLTEFGMLTNVQVVAGEDLLRRAVEEAARHSVPYTICTTANNEEHRSLTLNILHGVVQEHRNMPLEDAMPFLSRNFDNFVELMKKKISAVNEWIPPKTKVAFLMKLLADGRRATHAELMEVDEYIQGAIGRMKSVEATAANAGMAATRDDPSDRFRTSNVLVDSFVGRGGDRYIADDIRDGARGLPDQRLAIRGDALDIRGGGSETRGRGIAGRGGGLDSRDGGLDGRGGEFVNRGSAQQRAQLLPEPGRDMLSERPHREPEYELARSGLQDQYGGRASGLSGEGDRFQMTNGEKFASSSAQSVGGVGLRFESTAVQRALDDLINASRSNAGQSLPLSRGFPY